MAFESMPTKAGRSSIKQLNEKVADFLAKTGTRKRAEVLITAEVDTEKTAFDLFFNDVFGEISRHVSGVLADKTAEEQKISAATRHLAKITGQMALDGVHTAFVYAKTDKNEPLIGFFWRFLGGSEWEVASFCDYHVMVYPFLPSRNLSEFEDEIAKFGTKCEHFNQMLTILKHLLKNGYTLDRQVYPEPMDEHDGWIVIAELSRMKRFKFQANRESAERLAHMWENIRVKKALLEYEDNAIAIRMRFKLKFKAKKFQLRDFDTTEPLFTGKYDVRSFLNLAATLDELVSDGDWHDKIEAATKHIAKKYDLTDNEA